MSTAFKAATLCFAIAISAGCANPPPQTAARDDPQLRVVMNCSAGVLASYKTAAEVASDLRTKISLGVNVEDAAKGYIFEQLPPADRLAGYDKYLACVKEQTGSQRGPSGPGY